METIGLMSQDGFAGVGMEQTEWLRHVEVTLSMIADVAGVKSVVVWEVSSFFGMASYLTMSYKSIRIKTTVAQSQMSVTLWS
jgi:ABC-type proline/glycine betaine transport system permease subunit